MAETVTHRWTPRGAWAGIAAPGRFGADGATGVTAVLRDGFGLATLIVPEDRTAPLAEAVRAATGLDLPAGPAACMSGSYALIWSGPGQWLLRARSRSGFGDLLAALAPHAAVSDQSDARAGLGISGAAVRQALAKGAMVDLHPSAFPVGAAALTSFAQVGVHLWRAADGPEGAVFEILVSRSMAGSFWSWFVASAAEFGCVVTASQE